MFAVSQATLAQGAGRELEADTIARRAPTCMPVQFCSGEAKAKLEAAPSVEDTLAQLGVRRQAPPPAQCGSSPTPPLPPAPAQLGRGSYAPPETVAERLAEVERELLLHGGIDRLRENAVAVGLGAESVDSVHRAMRRIDARHGPSAHGSVGPLTAQQAERARKSAGERSRLWAALVDAVLARKVQTKPWLERVALAQGAAARPTGAEVEGGCEEDAAEAQASPAPVVVDAEETEAPTTGEPANVLSYVRGYVALDPGRKGRGGG